MIHFEHGYICKNSHSFAYGCSVVPAFVDYPFSIEVPLPFCKKSVDFICMGLFLGSLFCSLDLFVNLFANIILS